MCTERRTNIYSVHRYLSFNYARGESCFLSFYKVTVLVIPPWTSFLVLFAVSAGMSSLYGLNNCKCKQTPRRMFLGAQRCVASSTVPFGPLEQQPNSHFLMHASLPHHTQLCNWTNSAACYDSYAHERRSSTWLLGLPPDFLVCTPSEPAQ
jgi:hypothetical protein